MPVILRVLAISKVCCPTAHTARARWKRMLAHLDTIQPRGVSDYLAAHHDLIRGTPLEPILEPRRIQAPPGYHSTKSVPAGLFLLLGQGRLKGFLRMGRMAS